MNLRELARRDAAVTIEGSQAGNVLATLTSLDGKEWPDVPMILSDVGYSFDTEGNKVVGRTCWATYVAERVADEGKILYPRRGWRLSWVDLDGKTQEMFVSFCEPDRTVGWNRLFMVASLKDEGDEDAGDN